MIRARLAGAGVLAALACSAPALAQTAYAIANGGSTLIRFSVNNPSDVTVIGSFGGANTFLDAIDFRPATGQLYGYLDSADSFYTVDLATAQLTLASVGASGAPTNTFQLGLDFNPTIDRARVITDSDQNIVFNPIAGTAAAFTNVFYGAGDPNENTDPNIIDNAYTRNFQGATATRQYAIDYGINALVTVANNAGTLGTVGALGVDTGIYSGFDIHSTFATDTAYAILTPDAGTPGFYTINLGTGQATLVGSLGFTNQVYSLAVIPAPGTVTILAATTLAALRRRRR
jgi:hypothetical protein